MKGVCLRFYMNESEKHHGVLMHEWLLKLAKKNGIQGGYAFRAIAGYGQHGVMHEEHFFELASNVPIEVKFLTKKEEAMHFLEIIKKEVPNLFYSITASEYGIVSEL